METYGDENQDSSNFQSEVTVATQSQLVKPVTRTPAAPRTTSTAASKRASQTVTKLPPRTPGSRASIHSSSSNVTDLPPAALVKLLVQQATPASDPKIEAWPAQEKFTTTLLEALKAHPCNTSASENEMDGLTPLLPSHAALFVSALATTVSCGRSGTQRTTMECYRLLFERGSVLPGLRDALDRSLDVAFAALVKLVEHNSSAFLHQSSTMCLRAAMRHVNPGKLLHGLAKEIRSSQHDANLKKMIGLTGLMSDAMDIIVYGHFNGPAAKEYVCQPCTVLPSLAQAYYKEIIRCIVKIKRGQLPQLQPAANSMIQGLASKGQTNSVLTAEIRELSKTDRTAVTQFEAAYKTIVGKDLTTLTTSSSGIESSPTTGRTKGGLSSTLTSPLPSSARALRSANREMAHTMPRDILSPGEGKFETNQHTPLITASFSPNLANMIGSSTKLREQTFALPTPNPDQEYNTDGAGLLESLTVANAGDDTATVLGASSWMYSYDDSQINTSGASSTEVAQKLDFDSEANGVTTNGISNETTNLAVDCPPLEVDTQMNESTESNEEEDEITFKTNDAPTMNLTVVVDDSLNISSTQIPLDNVSPTMQQSVSTLSSSLVYNYDRSSMTGIPPTTVALYTANTTTATVTSSSPCRNSDKKRKFVDESSSSVAASVASVPVAANLNSSMMNSSMIHLPNGSPMHHRASGIPSSIAISPTSELSYLSSITEQQLKKHKSIVGDVSSASDPPPLSSHATRSRVAELAHQMVVDAAAKHTKEQAYWQEKRTYIQAKRGKYAAKKSAAAAAASATEGDVNMQQ